MHRFLRRPLLGVETGLVFLRMLHHIELCLLQCNSPSLYYIVGYNVGYESFLHIDFRNIFANHRICYLFR